MIRKILIRVRLAGLRYDSYGIIIPWNEAYLYIPYEQLQLKPSIPYLLEQVKGGLGGEMTVSLQCHLITGTLQKAEVLDGNAQQELSNTISRLEVLAAEIKSSTSQCSLTFQDARLILSRHRFSLGDDKIHNILTGIIDHMPPQQVQEPIDVPFSQLRVSEDGVWFRHNNMSFQVLSDKISFEDHAIFEIVKNSLIGNLTVTLQYNRVLKWDRIASNLLVVITQIMIAGFDPKTIQRLTEISSQIHKLVDGIKSSASQRSLTFEGAKLMFSNHGFDCTDDQIHDILTGIIDHMPLQQKDETIDVPLSHLQYSDDGVRFYHNNMHLLVPSNKLPFKVRAIFGTIKESLIGNLTITLRFHNMLKWDRNTSSLLIGQISIEVIAALMDAETLKALKRQLCNFVCQEIMESEERSIERVESLLEKWGLYAPDKEVGEQIASTIPPWGQEQTQKFSIPLNQIEFNDSWIIGPFNGKGIKIYNPPFKTSKAINKIKVIFEDKNKISIFLSKTFRFHWNGSCLIVKEETHFGIEELDEDTKKKLNKINDFSSGSIVVPLPPGPIKIVIDGPPPPPPPPKPREYDFECIGFLFEKSKGVYITSENFWFHIGKCLVWEHPNYGVATYIFTYPEEAVLRIIIDKNEISDLNAIRAYPEISGYKGRVFHDSNAISDWKDNVERKLIEC